ncbi:MAG: hypothetical protein KKE73_01055 [Proteobacteria bacterium]|nr:hypothetical protein [Pseudomonadota bacterium]
MDSIRVDHERILDLLLENELLGIALIKGDEVKCLSPTVSRLLGCDTTPPCRTELLDSLQRIIREFRGQSSGSEGAPCCISDVIELENPDGGISYFRFHALGFKGAKSTDEMHGVELFVFQDITFAHEKVLEIEKMLVDMEEAKMAQEDNSNLLNDMLVQLKIAEQERAEKEKMQGVLELAAAACHELSQPLQYAMGDVEYIAGKSELDEDFAKAVGSLKQSVDEMADIIRKIRGITSYKTMEYTTGVQMIDLDESSRRDEEPLEVTDTALDAPGPDDDSGPSI